MKVYNLQRREWDGEKYIDHVIAIYADRDTAQEEAHRLDVELGEKGLVPGTYHRVTRHIVRGLKPEMSSLNLRAITAAWGLEALTVRRDMANAGIGLPEWYEPLTVEQAALVARECADTVRAHQALRAVQAQQQSEPQREEIYRFSVTRPEKQESRLWGRWFTIRFGVWVEGSGKLRRTESYRVTEHALATLVEKIRCVRSREDG